MDTKVTNIQIHISYQTFLCPSSSVPQATQATWRKSLFLKTFEKLCTFVAHNCISYLTWYLYVKPLFFTKNFIIPISLETMHIKLSSQDCCFLEFKSLLHPTWYCCHVTTKGCAKLLEAKFKSFPEVHMKRLMVSLRTGP